MTKTERPARTDLAIAVGLLTALVLALIFPATRPLITDVFLTAWNGLVIMINGLGEGVAAVIDWFQDLP